MNTLRIIILAGIACIGISLNSCKHEPELPSGTPTVYFNTDVMLILNSKCSISGCHGSGEAPGLNTYSEVSRFVTPLKPIQSKLYKVISSNSWLNRMPPKSSDALNKTQIDMISIWILQGAQDN